MKISLLAIIIVLFVSCVSKDKYNLERQNAYDEGYLNGYKAGQKKAYKDIDDIINSKKNYR